MRKYAFISISTFLICFLMPDANARPAYQENTEVVCPCVSIKVTNTSMFTVSSEVKCLPHNNKTKKYKFYQILTIEGDSYKVVKVPANLEKCEIWSVLGRW